MRLSFYIPFLLLLSSTSFSQKIQKEGIPADFNCTGCILVVFKKEVGEGDNKLKKKENEKMNELFESKVIKDYDGKSVFITEKELNSNPLYADKNVYRFVLQGHTYGVQASTIVDVPGAHPPPKPGMLPGQKEYRYTMGALSLALYDRLTGKGYPQLANWPSWAKNMEKVTEALNKKLK
jgi:hypothetical protein